MDIDKTYDEIQKLGEETLRLYMIIQSSIRLDDLVLQAAAMNAMDALESEPQTNSTVVAAYLWIVRGISPAKLVKMSREEFLEAWEDIKKVPANDAAREAVSTIKRHARLTNWTDFTSLSKWVN